MLKKLTLVSPDAVVNRSTHITEWPGGIPAAEPVTTVFRTAHPAPMQCQCGNHMDPQDRYCGQCGRSRFRHKAEQTTLVHKNFCQECGTQLEPDAAFCGQCGAERATSLIAAITRQQ